MVAFDVETTGVDVENDRIVTVAITDVRAGDAPRTWTAIADPGIEIPTEAAEIHGFTTERARAEGAPAREVVAATLTTLRNSVLIAPLVIFNARFDLTVLDREARRHGLEPLVGGVVIDPLVIDKHLDRYRKGSRKLDAICEAYGAKLDGAHDAGADSLAAARAAWVLGAKGRVIRRAWNPEMYRERAALEREWEDVRYDIGRLHDAQQRWAMAEAVRLAEYFELQGQDEDAAGVRVEWPVVPFAEHVQEALL